MMPTFDFVNLVKRAVKAALATVTGRTVAAIGFAATLTSLFYELGLSNIIYEFIPNFGSWQTLLVNYSNIHQQFFDVLFYSIALDYAFEFLSRFLDFLDFIFVHVPVFFVALIPSIWLIQILRGGRKDINDAVS